MNWVVKDRQDRQDLTVSIGNINHISTTSDVNRWKNLRKSALEKFKHICLYCGGKYNKYLFCVPSSNSIDDLTVMCKLCYMITHINYNFCNELMLCHSKLTQVDIVRKTVDFIIKEQKVPGVADLDKDAKIVPLSLMELSNILTNNKLPKIMKDNYKIFVTCNLDTSFVEYNKIIRPLFIDEESEEFEFSTNIPDNTINNECAIYEFTKKEEKFLKNFFDSTYDHITAKMEECLALAEFS